MSSQFSYELDERQIRVMMQDAELDCNETLWNKFELLEPSLECKPSSAIKIYNYIPKFNFGISRSVIVPIIFMVLIGSLSAMLFNLVDFKKKEVIDKEIPLVANPKNFKKTGVDVAKMVTPIEVKKTPDTSITTSVVTPSKIEEPLKITPAETEVKKLKSENILELTNIEVAKPIAAESKKETIAQPIKKKKVVTEELPTIKATTNLNEGVSQPELDLDLK